MRCLAVKLGSWEPDEKMGESINLSVSHPMIDTDFGIGGRPQDFKFLIQLLLWRSLTQKASSAYAHSYRKRVLSVFQEQKTFLTLQAEIVALQEFSFLDAAERPGVVP